MQLLLVIVVFLVHVVVVLLAQLELVLAPPLVQDPFDPFLRILLDLFKSLSKFWIGRRTIGSPYEASLRDPGLKASTGRAGAGTDSGGTHSGGGGGGAAAGPTHGALGAGDTKPPPVLGAAETRDRGS